MSEETEIKKEVVESKPSDKKYSVKFKRNRSSRACGVCHSRKVRCDATIHIPCTNCLTFGCECKFPEPKERKNAKKKKINEDNDIDEKKTNNNNNNNNVQSNQNIINTSASKRKYEPLAAISARNAKIDTQNLFKRNSNSISFIGSASSAALLADHNETPSHVSMDTWVPPSLQATISTTRTSLDTVQMEILRLRGAFHLPEKSLCDDLINTYFQRIYPIEPIVDKKTFMEEYENNTVSLLLLQSILLAASRVTSNRLIFDSNGSNYLASCTFYQRAKALYDANYENDPIAVVQSLILFSRFWEGIDDVLGNSFYWIRVATCVAQGYGFHRNMEDSVLTPNKIRISRILWWQLYIKDISASVGFGRPKMIQLDDCDVPMLTSDDLPSDLSRTDAEAFIQMIRLSEIMSIVLSEQYSVRAEKSRHKDHLAINHCDMIMSSWRNALPSALQYSPHHHLTLSVNILNLYYYSVVCLVHRSNMVRAPLSNGKQYPSEGIVFRASRIIADIASKLIKSNDIRYCHALAIPIFFTASLTFICHMDSKNDAIAKSSKIGYNICYEALKAIGNNFLIATLIHHSMNKIATDSKARERFIQSLVRKDKSLPNTRDPTPISTNVNTPAQSNSNLRGMGPPNSSIPPTPQFFNQQSPQTMSFMPNSIPMVPSNLPTPIPIPSHIQTNSNVQSPNIPMEGFTPQPDQLEFPSLYLFTNTLPSASNGNFDPSQLFPSNSGKESNDSHSESSITDNFNPNEFNLSLPEFNSQSFTNSISLQNLSALNNYIDDGSGSNQIQQQIPNNHDTPSSSIYSFIN